MKNYTGNEIVEMLILYTSNAANIKFEQFESKEIEVREEFAEFDRKWQELPADDDGFNADQDKAADELLEEYANKVLEILK